MKKLMAYLLATVAALPTPSVPLAGIALAASTIGGASTAQATPIPNGSLQISGTVWYISGWYIYPARYAQVTARRTADGYCVSTWTDYRGNYSLNLRGGEWIVTACANYDYRWYSGTCATRASVWSDWPRTAAGFNINMTSR